MGNLNLKLFHYINDLSMKHHILDEIMIFTSKYIIYIFMLILVLGFFLSILCKNTHLKKITIITAIITLINLMISSIIGKLFFVNRPFIFCKTNLLYYHKCTSSFPSNHSIIMLSISLGILKYNKFLGILSILLSILVGFSRIYVGHHYPFDVLGGFLISILTTYIFSACEQNKSLSN